MHSLRIASRTSPGSMLVVFRQLVLKWKAKRNRKKVETHKRDELTYFIISFNSIWQIAQFTLDPLIPALETTHLVIEMSDLIPSCVDLAPRSAGYFKLKEEDILGRSLGPAFWNGLECSGRVRRWCSWSLAYFPVIRRCKS